MTARPLPYSSKGDLTSGPVRGHLVRMALPMIWSIFAVLAVQLTNTFFISRLGTLPLAAISFTFPVTLVVSHLLFGLNIALSSVVSRLIGEKRTEDVRRVTLHGIMFAVCVAAVIALLAYVFLEPLFHALGADETVMPLIREYMPLWLFASILLAVPVNGNSAIRAAGDTLRPAMVMISMAVLNFMLDPVLIYGWFGVPAFGVKGAAISTTIAYSFALVFGLYILIYKKDMVSTDSLHMDKLGDSLRRLIFIAIPAGIANIIQPATGAVITALLAVHGHQAVAAYGVATRIEALAMIIVFALAMGMAPIIGQNWGARLYDRVHEVINLSIRFNFIWSFFIAIIFGGFAGYIVSAFSKDATVIHNARLYFWIVPFSYAFANLVFGWSSAFNAMGMPQRAFVMILAKSLLTIPVAWAGGHLYGPAGIFWAITLTNLGSGFVSHLASGRAMHEMEKPAPEALADISR